MRKKIWFLSRRKIHCTAEAQEIIGRGYQQPHAGFLSVGKLARVKQQKRKNYTTVGIAALCFYANEGTDEVDLVSPWFPIQVNGRERFKFPCQRIRSNHGPAVSALAQICRIVRQCRSVASGRLENPWFHVLSKMDLKMGRM